jgi:predicted RNase H-like HicB family nuclease
VENKFTIIYEPAEEGGYTAYIPEVPGAISEGETIEKAREMVLDALRELSEYRRETAIEAKAQDAVVEAIAI